MEVETKLSMGNCKVRGITAKDNRIAEIAGQKIHALYEQKKKKQPDKADELDFMLNVELANASLKMEANCILEHDFEIPQGIPLWEYISLFNGEDDKLFRTALNKASGMGDTPKKSKRGSQAKRSGEKPRKSSKK